jgi:hypothetical protein
MLRAREPARCAGTRLLGTRPRQRNRRLIVLRQLFRLRAEHPVRLRLPVVNGGRKRALALFP